MEQCSYIMCDGYQCQCVGEVTVDGKPYCDTHAVAIKDGRDPMEEEDYGY